MKKYTITITGRFTSFRSLLVENDFAEKHHGEDIDELFMSEIEERDWEFENSEDEYFLNDRTNIRVTDENDNVIFETENAEDIKYVDTGLKFQFDDGWHFCRDSTFKGSGMVYTIETEDETFNPKKLYWTTYPSDLPIEKSGYYVGGISYKGGEVTFEDYDEYSFFEEQYWDTMLIKTKNGEIVEEVKDL